MPYQGLKCFLKSKFPTAAIIALTWDHSLSARTTHACWRSVRPFRQGGRTPDGLLPIEGPNLITEARRAGIEVVEMFLESGTDPPPERPV